MMNAREGVIEQRVYKSLRGGGLTYDQKRGDEGRRHFVYYILRSQYP